MVPTKKVLRKNSLLSAQYIAALFFENDKTKGENENNSA